MIKTIESSCIFEIIIKLDDDNTPQLEIIEASKNDYEVIEREWEDIGLSLFFTNDEIDKLYTDGSIRLRGKFNYYEWDSIDYGKDYDIEFVKIS